MGRSLRAGDGLRVESPARRLLPPGSWSHLETELELPATRAAGRDQKVRGFEQAMHGVFRGKSGGGG